ncbi:hypothetical protein [Hymenobacter sp. 5516J-16]|uniref:hypothetical protein n=1 Tax=Hymenobacter sp. 5516J-16 TaxID=2932253 RepID=UPI00293EB2DD|nr:hypothetical protein [Hymenobacter sp. 5516J-16]
MTEKPARSRVSDTVPVEGSLQILLHGAEALHGSLHEFIIQEQMYIRFAGQVQLAYLIGLL